MEMAEAGMYVVYVLYSQDIPEAPERAMTDQINEVSICTFSYKHCSMYCPTELF